MPIAAAKGIARRTVVAFVACAAIAAPLRVHAGAPQGAPASNPADNVRRARALYDRAEAQYRLGEFDKALADYRAAARLSPRPSLVFNIAQCYRQLKRYDKAIFYYKLYLADWRRAHPGRTPPQHDEVQRRIAELSAAAAAERARRAAGPRAPTSGRLSLAGLTIDGARVVVDGVLRGVTPLLQEIELEAGAHRLRVEAAGHKPFAQGVVIRGGQRTEIWIRLERPRPRSALWLAAAISCAVLAAGAETMALVFRSKAAEHYEGTPPFEDDRRLTNIGHGLAAGLGALAVTSLVLYLLSGERAPSNTVALSPTLDGAAVRARISF